MVIVIIGIIKIFSNKTNFNINFSIHIVLVSFQCKLATSNSVTDIQSKTSHKSSAVQYNVIFYYNQLMHKYIYITFLCLLDRASSL